MNAIEFLYSIELLLERELHREATYLFIRIKKEIPELLRGETWNKVESLIPSIGGGVKGYRFVREKCHYCSKEVARNWFERHKEKCKND